jgi:hypothetical protein
MLEPMLINIRVPLMTVLIDAVLHRVAGGPDACGGADVRVLGDPA